MKYIKYWALFLFSLIYGLSLYAQEVDQAELLSQWKNDAIPGSFSFNNAYNEVWGLSVNDREFAVIGSTLGTHILDVTNPREIEEIHFVEGAVSSPVIIHRDYHDFNGYLYAVADEGTQSTLQIIDISNLPGSIEVIYDDNEILYRSHNIFIDTSTAIMYSFISGAAGMNFDFVPMRLFDISDPFNPEIITSINSIDGVAFSQVHDGYVRNGIVYMNNGPTGFSIADFTDPLNPSILGTLFPSEYPQAGYNHSGWLSEGGDHYYMADETWGMDMKVLDVSALPDIMVVDTIDAGSESPNTIPHNQVVAGDYLYSSYYYDGLQVYDISDPASPERILHYPTSSIPHRRDYEGAWGVYPFLPSGNILVSDMQEGLFVIEGPQSITNTENKLKEPLDFIVSPNPTSDVISVSFNRQIPEQIFITNALGQLIFDLKSDANNIEIPVSRFDSGTYFITALIEGYIYSEVFVKI